MSDKNTGSRVKPAPTAHRSEVNGDFTDPQNKQARECANTSRTEASEEAMFSMNNYTRPLRTADGKIVANAKFDFTTGHWNVHKEIDFSRHLLRKPPAIAFDTFVLKQAERHGCVGIAVLDRDSGSIYRTDLATFNQYCFTLNRYHGEQKALVLYKWSKDGEPPSTPSSLRKPVKPTQPDLFDNVIMLSFDEEQAA